MTATANENRDWRRDRRLKMNNIKEMEKILEEYKIRDRYVFVRDFMEHCINSLKDLHEENCKLWKELAKMKGEI